MKLSNRWHILGWTGLTVLILFIMFTGTAVSLPIAYGNAQPTIDSTRFATPLPSPQHNGGRATWTVKSMGFVSKYPTGFVFTLDASSSLGKITLAQVLWRHAANKPTSMMVQADKTGKFVAYWTTSVFQTVPGWVGVDYWWVLTDERGNSFETPHQYSEYADNTRKWRRLVTEDAVIHWEASLPADIGPQIAASLKQQRDRYLQGWGKLLNYKPHIMIYASYKPWKEWMPKVNDQWIDGETSSYWGGTVQVYHANNANGLKYLTYGVILHEVEHLYQQTFSPYDTWHRQVWFYEGDATSFELYQSYDFLQTVKDMAARRQLPALQKAPALLLEDRMPYDVGYSFWKYIEVTFGPDMHRLIWDQIRRGQPIEGSLQTATGKPFADLEKDFRAWVGAGDPIK
ncbi:MAG: hypothetical protein ABI947_18205 [Chloroflexota bacterium]